MKVLFGDVTNIDPSAREIRLRSGERMRFRYLVLASGAGPGYFGHDQWAQWAPGLKAIEDALHIRSRLLLTFERAERTKDPAERRRLLSIVIIGGGPTGVELAGAIAELSRYTLARDSCSIDPQTTRIVLVEAGPRLLAGFAEELSAYTHARLKRLGVEVLTGSAVETIHPDRISIAGRHTPVGLVIWAAGVSASPLARQLGPTDQAGRIAGDEFLAVPGYMGVFALGDVAAFTGDNGRPLPGLRQRLEDAEGRACAILGRNRRRRPGVRGGNPADQIR